MKTIYKYDILKPQDGIIEGPITRILYAGEQDGSIKVWAEVDTKIPNKKFGFVPVGTGWNLELEDGTNIIDSYNYLNTVVMTVGLVFHVYYTEILPAPVKTTEPPKEKGEIKAVIDNTKEAAFSETITMINPDILRKFV